MKNESNEDSLRPPGYEYDWTKKEHVGKSPIWCSVDLRDGNQALVEPMGLREKLEFFQMLVEIGFKEIEVGVPAASDAEFKFVRTLVERDMIPGDVTIQVLTPAGIHAIRKTFEAVKGAPHVIIHLYNAASNELSKQRAVDGARLLKQMADETGRKFLFEYSPENFHKTEVQHVVEVCNAVLDVWKPDERNKVIVNIPTTVETVLSHVFANQIEYISNNLKGRENVILSIHPHNNRGCGICDAELGILAGADRVEGTLFGTEERNGNVDIIKVAMNLFEYGVDSGLDFSNLSRIREKYGRLTRKYFYERQPYAYILKQNFSLAIPEKMWEEVSRLVKRMSAAERKELSPQWVYEIFEENYIHRTPYFQITESHFTQADGIMAEVTITQGGKKTVVDANGNGRLDAVSNTIKQFFGVNYEVSVYEEHALSRGSASKAAAYVGIVSGGKLYWGAGMDEDIIKASIHALVVAVNKLPQIQTDEKLKDDRLVAMLNYIQTNYQRVTLEDIAGHFHLSEPYISKYIKEKSGKTFGEHVTGIRMKRAKTLLKNGNMTVENISYAVGYQNVEHFNRTFKKSFEMTPMQYRNRSREA